MGRHRRRRLLEGDESGRGGRANTGAAVTDGLVRDRELAEVVADHLGLRAVASRWLALDRAADAPGPTTFAQSAAATACHANRQLHRAKPSA